MDEKTRVCGPVANPVEYSISPLMRNFYAQRIGVNLIYAPFEVKSEQVGDAIKGAFALNILGMNVTMPRKQRVTEFLADIDGDAKAIDTVNTLAQTEHGYRGYNTDVAGLTRALLGAEVHVSGERCILINTGGAARAAVYVLTKEGIASIYIMNRNLGRAQELAEYISRLVGRNPASASLLDGYESISQEKGRYLVTQSTSVGMRPHVEDVIVEDRYFYELIHVGVDIMYTPARARLMELVEEAGGKAVNGLDMLLYRGIIVYEPWNPQVRMGKETISVAKQLTQDHLSISQAEYNLTLTESMGVRKASVDDCYARECGLLIADTDQRAEAVVGMAISKIFATQGEEAFRRLETGVLEELLAHTDHSIISVGGGFPLWGENKILLKKLSCAVYLDVSPETVVGRIGRDVSNKPMLQGGDVELRIRGLLAIRRPVYLEASHVIMDVNGRSVEKTAEKVHYRTGI